MRCKMANEHDVLIQKYQSYKDELIEYEKEKFLYETKISEYGEQIVAQISQLRNLGIEIKSLNEIVDEEGNIDLTNESNLRKIIDEVYQIYRDNISVGLKILEDRE